ncbi:MAG: hypothetical protein SFV51_28465 [Bryobacteraceae bacterium]|nr:hypothetical protein [Bryobacteraceae bacterium]
MKATPAHDDAAGTGQPEIDASKCVFINCPFDEEYAPLLDAMIMAVVCCGFIPRSSIESGDVAEPRMNRVMRAVFGSRYSIHDLSRCKGEGVGNLARFNMPLELGVAMARRYLDDRQHDWLALVPDRVDYGSFASDLAGFDLMRHNGTVFGVVTATMAWLITRGGAVQLASPKKVAAKVPDFGRRRALLSAKWGGYPPWMHVVDIAVRIAARL